MYIHIVIKPLARKRASAYRLIRKIERLAERHGYFVAMSYVGEDSYGR